MSRIEKLKEEVGLLKFWLGLLAISILGVVGWVFTHLLTNPLWHLFIASLSLIPLFLGIIFLMKKIDILLKKIEKE